VLSELKPYAGIVSVLLEEDAVTVWRETRLGGDAFEPVASRLVLRWGDVFNSAPGYWQTKLRKAFADPPFTP